MKTNRRINVTSGRTLEKLAHYSRALRVGDMVLQSGTTAIDRQGNVRGVGDVTKQVESIMTIAEWSMAKAGGTLADVVRSRIYVTDIGVGPDAGRALARYFRDVRPTATLVQVSGLARPEQLVEIELDAVDGAGKAARRISSGRAIEDEAEAVVGAARTRRDIYTQQQREKPRGYARAVEVGDWIWVSGCTSMNAAGQPQGLNDWAAQSDLSHETIRWALEQAGATLDDVVRRRIFTVDGARVNRPHGEGPAWVAKSDPASL